MAAEGAAGGAAGGGWRGGWGAAEKTSSPVFNFNFNSNTNKPYMILKAQNVVYKIVSGTHLWTLHASGVI